MIKCLNANHLYILMVTIRSKKWISPAVMPLLHSKAGSKCGLCGMTIVFFIKLYSDKYVCVYTSTYARIYRNQFL